jgi:hypothetical protein
MKKFIALKVSHLKLDNLAGLVSETVVIADRQKAALGPVATSIFGMLGPASHNFRQWLNVNRRSTLTPQIDALDKRRDADFREIRRTAKAAQKSAVAATAAAGTVLMELLRPIWGISKEPLMSQTVQLSIFFDRIAADPAAGAAVTTLGLAPVLADLTGANIKLKDLYNARLDEMSALDGHSASDNSKGVIMLYDSFCMAIEITLFAQPSDDLQTIFNEMNDLRRKYISRLPIRLTGALTSVAFIPEQIYTGEPLLPLPRVFYQDGDELRELVFAQDFTVTYRHNVDVGEARLLVHGKGRYTGTYVTTFHIVAGYEG